MGKKFKIEATLGPDKPDIWSNCLANISRTDGAGDLSPNCTKADQIRPLKNVSEDVSVLSVEVTCKSC